MKKTYAAILAFVQPCRGEVLIKAHSLKDARQKANEIRADEVDWNPLDGKMSTEHIIELKPQKKNRQP
jgi:hypothetical protein